METDLAQYEHGNPPVCQFKAPACSCTIYVRRDTSVKRHDAALFKFARAVPCQFPVPSLDMAVALEQHPARTPELAHKI